jgi:glycosyltransferase involved in cell wall biosynthesis
VEARICYVTPEYPTLDRPDMGRMLFEVCRRIEVPSLIQARLEGGSPVAPPPHARLHGVRIGDVRLAGRQGWALRGALAGKASIYTTFFARCLPRLAAFRPTLVHLETPIPFLHGLFAKGVLSARLSIGLIGTDFLWVQRSRVLQALVRHADVLLPVSPHMQAILAALAPRARIVVVPPMVDREIFRPLALPRCPQFVTAASFRWEKAHDVLLDAFRRVLDRHPGARLVLAGTGYLEDWIRAQVRTLNLEDAVTLAGHVAPERLARLMNECTACVLSSRSEGSPRALKEAISCGTPVIATNVGHCRTIVEGAGMTVAPEDPIALAAAMTALLEQPDLWRRCADACVSRSNDFDLDRRARLYAAAFAVT